MDMQLEEVKHHLWLEGYFDINITIGQEDESSCYLWIEGEKEPISFPTPECLDEFCVNMIWFIKTAVMMRSKKLVQ